MTWVTISGVAFLPALIVVILILLVILVTKFPDPHADRQVDTRAMVVVFGVPACVVVYRATLAVSYVLAAAMLLNRATFLGGAFYLQTLPLAVFAMRSASRQDLAPPSLYRANQLTILLHSVDSLAVAAVLLH